MVTASRRFAAYHLLVFERWAPILYVSDPYAERGFFESLGFERGYEGPEFPGFLSVRAGAFEFGLSGNRELGSGAHTGTQWQFVVADVDAVLARCRDAGVEHSVRVDVSDGYRVRLVTVVSPGGVEVWFEGPNEASNPVATPSEPGAP